MPVSDFHLAPRRTHSYALCEAARAAAVAVMKFHYQKLGSENTVTTRDGREQRDRTGPEGGRRRPEPDRHTYVYIRPLTVLDVRGVTLRVWTHDNVGICKFGRLACGHCAGARTTRPRPRPLGSLALSLSLSASRGSGGVASRRLASSPRPDANACVLCDPHVPPIDRAGMAMHHEKMRRRLG